MTDNEAKVPEKPRTPHKKPAQKNKAPSPRPVPWGLLRLGAAVLLLLVVGWMVWSPATAFVEEEYSSRAVSKGRVLLRGAQLLATQRLVEGDSREAAERWLLDPARLPDIVEAARFPVEPVKLDALKLNDKGIIDSFSCVLDYQGRRYQIVFDLPADRAEPTLLEKLPKADKPKKSETE